MAGGRCQHPVDGPFAGHTGLRPGMGRRNVHAIFGEDLVSDVALSLSQRLCLPGHGVALGVPGCNGSHGMPAERRL